MDRVNCVLYKAQQDYFRRASRTARENQAAHRPSAPTFDKIIDAVGIPAPYNFNGTPDQNGQVLTPMAGIFKEWFN
jgi:hypothetical protein